MIFTSWPIHHIISNDTIIITITNINILIFTITDTTIINNIIYLLLLLLILYSSLLLSESVLDSPLFTSVTTVFTLLLGIGQYLLITKKKKKIKKINFYKWYKKKKKKKIKKINFHKGYQYP